MVVVSVLVVSNTLTVGPNILFPATMATAVASPKALPMPNIAPAKIPDLALVRITLKFVCVRVAPSARLPSSTSLSTERIAVIDRDVIVGNIIIASNRITASKELPPAVTKPREDASELTSTVIVPDANTPYTTEGILASSSTTVVMTSATCLGAIFAINNAVSTDRGKEITSAPNAETSVLITIKPTP